MATAERARKKKPLVAALLLVPASLLLSYCLDMFVYSVKLISELFRRQFLADESQGLQITSTARKARKSNDRSQQ
jgi:hypothetical protein